MPGEVFGCRLDGYIHAVRKGLEVVDAPGVVHEHLGPSGMRRAGDGRHILHLKRVAAGAFGVDHLGVRAHQRGDAGLVDLGQVERCFDAEVVQHSGGEVAGRSVDVVGHQHVVAGF
jgi:hypothetical protein